MKRWALFLLIIGLSDAYELCSKGTNSTITSSVTTIEKIGKSVTCKGHDSATKLKRNKRFLLWSNGAVSKSVLGFLVPVQTGDKVNWRALNMAYSLQAQFAPIPSVIYPWTRFERSLEHQRYGFDKHGHFIRDNTRKFAYTAFELLMKRKGNNGKQCLLRAICEAAHTPVKVNGIFDEILHLFLTPNPNEIDDQYIDAMLIGKYGGNCFHIYPLCPMGNGLLDSISYLI